MKIRSPKTKRMITVNGATYNKLLSSGYKDELLKLTSENASVENGLTAPVENKYISSIPSIPSDVIDEILLSSDIDTIKNYCMTTKHQCNDYSLWKRIFDRDNIPLYEKQNSYIEYIKEYKKISKIIDEVEVIFKIIKDFNITNLNIHVSMNDYKLVKYHNADNFYVHIDELYTISLYHYKFGFGPKNNKFYQLDKEPFKNLLIEILYYYPDTKISSENHQGSYIPLRYNDLSISKTAASKRRKMYYKNF